MLSSILESKFYNTQEKEHSLSLNDTPPPLSADDTMEDDKLLRSLEKRFQEHAIRTDESPTQFQNDQLTGQTPSFQLVPKDNSQKSILDQLQNAMHNYDHKDVAEDRIKLCKDNDFIEKLDNDIKKTEESLKEMNERFSRIKQQ